MTRLVATFLYVGLIRPAPGTWGALAALPCAWALHTLGGFPAMVVATLLAIAAGWWAAGQVLLDQDDPDPSWVVIDEVAGMWMALLPVSAGAALADAPILALWPGWVVAFAAFRLLDIWKPGPIGWADRQAGATGVMLDDVIAGALAGVVVVLLAGLAHGVALW